MFAVRRAAANGGMVPAPVPTFTYNGTTSGTSSFTISNYNNQLSYTLNKTGSGNAPSLNTSTGVITVSGLTQTANSGTTTTAGGDFDMTVTSSSLKGGFTSTSSQPSRKLYTYYPYQYHYNIGPCSFSDAGVSYHYQNCHAPAHTHGKNGTPGGYSDSGSDWYRS